MDRLRWRMQYEPAPPPAPVTAKPRQDDAVLKDRSEEKPATAPPAGPVPDDDWYGKDMVNRQAW
jgi:hypothetical protein